MSLCVISMRVHACRQECAWPQNCLNAAGSYNEAAGVALIFLQFVSLLGERFLREAQSLDDCVSVCEEKKSRRAKVGSRRVVPGA